MTFKELQILLRKRFHLPYERGIKKVVSHFGLAERTFFYSCITLFALSGIALISQVSWAFMTEVPTYGDTLTEGVVGNPRFINPVLALSEADKNLTALVFSGLVRLSPKGEIENDLAKEITISPNKLTYTAKIDPEARFHDGTRVTADDVFFTIAKIQDPMIKSPRRGNWEGITVEKLDEETVRFALKRPYAPFIYNLTIGILPKHIWKNVTADEFSFSQFNTFPIGSGPYQVEAVERNEGGIPNYYKLSPHGSSFIKKLLFRFYSSENELIKAFNSGDVESIAGLSPERINELDTKRAQVIKAPLPRIFAVFLNQSKNKALLDKSVRQALDLSAPRVEIADKVFAGFAAPIAGPFPAGLFDWTLAPADQTGEAREILAKAGWQRNAFGILEKKSGNDKITLSFSISTGDAPELKRVAEELKSAWEGLGAKVEILTFESGELNQNVIRPRNFDALLFGELVGREADLYPFWHSTQRNDPGLNIALYANSKVDRLLEEARVTIEISAAGETYKTINDEIRKDMPAVFLYTPSFIYVVPEKVKGVAVGALLSSPDRFSGIAKWYIETDKVWKIFLD